jgi:ABC-type Zn uptake system ZnuABC Zn-binding protein ZnuA
MIRHSPLSFKILALAGVLLLLAGCAPTAQGQPGAALRVVATTTIVADVVQNVGGEHIQVTAMIPAGADEHGYEPTPRDVALAADADLLFTNGAGLETFIDRLVASAGSSADKSGAVTPIPVSAGIPLLQAALEDDPDHAAGGDPHVWTDPNNVLLWVDTIEHALVEADPPHAADYQKNAAAYRQQLKALDAWVRQQVEQVPLERRKLVTDHLVFTYFSARYGFEQVGAVVPGYSTLSAPSAQELAALEDSIRALGVPAIFLGNTVSPNLTERVAQDTGVRVVPVITGSLTDQNGPAPTYLDYIRYNVSAITGALK